jgi:hypothetical protein
MSVVFDTMTGEPISLNDNGKLRHPHTIENETRLIDVVVYKDGKRVESNIWEEELTIDSAADMMALTLPYYKDKKILIIKMSEWKRGRRVEIPKPLKCFVCGKLTCRGECDEDTFLGLI